MLVLILLSVNAFGQTPADKSLDAYTGLNFGYRLFRQDAEDRKEYDIRKNGYEVGLDQYIFGSGKPLGFYVGLGLHFPNRPTIAVASAAGSGSTGSSGVSNEPLDFDMALDLTAIIGLASRVTIGKSPELLMGIGPSVTVGGYTSSFGEYIKKLDMSWGVGINTSMLFRLSDWAALTIGARAHISISAVQYLETVDKYGSNKTPVRTRKERTDYLEFNVTMYIGMTFRY